MNRICIAARVFSSAIMSPFLAQAGPNQGGVLLLHADADIEWTTGQAYCAPTIADDDSAIVSVDASRGFPTIIFLMAAFADSNQVRLSGMTFSTSWDSTLVITSHGSCADFELPSTGWPESGTGIGIRWFEVQTSALVPVYWFAVYSAYGYDGSFAVCETIGRPAEFADDSVPSSIDAVCGFGSVGFGSDGFAPRPYFLDPKCGILEAVW